MTQRPGETGGAPAPGVTTGPGGGGHDGRNLGLALLLVSAAQFVLQLDFSIVNVALATIQREFGPSAADLQWIVTGYALPFGALLLLGGRIGDLTGHRRLLVSGLALFGLDVAGAVLVTVSVAALIFGLSQGQQHGFAAPETVAALAAVLLGAAFVAVERRVATPMVPVRVLADQARQVALGTMFLVGSVIVGYLFCSPVRRPSGRW
ncbi:MAG TPA: MFS transporter [Trebonia sp.]